MSIAVQGTTLYALIQTPSFNELTAYDLTQINNPFFSGFQSSFLAPLEITNLLPQNSIVSIAIASTTNPTRLSEPSSIAILTLALLILGMTRKVSPRCRALVAQ